MNRPNLRLPERIKQPLPIGQPLPTCEICGSPATLRLYRDGGPRAIWSCQTCESWASAHIGGASLIREL
jgi:hypothetical protein